jgi:hypothetical protein
MTPAQIALILSLAATYGPGIVTDIKKLMGSFNSDTATAADWMVKLETLELTLTEMQLK